jgi:pimeloyl-ACP methyl ester carboxylesterase
MSAIVLQQHLTHYEIIGRGQPVLFLHSWLGSWRTWMPTMEMIADRYRAVALDFWGFGDSAARLQPPTIGDYVGQVCDFVERLGMLPPHLVGHGLGGIVAVQAASTYPERFGKVLVAGMPVKGLLLQPALKPSGIGRLLGRGSANDTWARIVRQSAGGDADVAEVLEDLAAAHTPTLQSVVDEVGATDLRSMIAALPQPLLAIYGARDRLLSAEHGRLIAETASTFRQVLTFDKSGHFAFLDQPTQFNRALLEFLGGSEKAIELKEIWKRRVSQREFL